MVVRAKCFQKNAADAGGAQRRGGKKGTTKSASSSTRTPAACAPQQHPPTGELRNLIQEASSRVIWLGERDEAGESRCAGGKESKARSFEALTAYALRMQHVSPLLWFLEADVLLAWKDGVASAVAVVLELARQQGVDPSEIARRLVSYETFKVLLESALAPLLNGGDTCAAAPKARLVQGACKILHRLVPSEVCPWGLLEERIQQVQDEAYSALAHIRAPSSGILYTSSTQRGMLDKQLHRHLFERKCYYGLPASWGGSPPPSFTPEQAEVFAHVLAHARSRGWSVLSGPGGSGKTHMMRHLVELIAAARVYDEGDGPDCPMCGQERLATKCNACAYLRQAEGEREVRACFMGPTNRAVAVLLSIAQADEAVPTSTFGTVHSLCRRSDVPRQDIVVVDEASMLSSEHGDLLLRSRAFRKAVWFLVGDHLQLPPVGCGELLRPLLERSSLPALQRNLRVKSSALADLIRGVREGRAESVLGCERHFENVMDLVRGVRAEACDIVLCIRNEERVRYNAFCIQERPCEVAGLRAMDDYRKMRLGDAASSAKTAPAPRSFVPFVGMPVRFQNNDFKPRACRGDLGRLEAVRLEGRVWTIDVALRAEVISMRASFFAIPELIRPAFATTLHDAQGAQMRRVGVIMPSSATCPLLTLETLYTAASRAEQDLLLFTCGCRLAPMLGVLAAPSPKRRTPLSLYMEAPPTPRACSGDGSSVAFLNSGNPSPQAAGC